MKELFLKLVKELQGISWHIRANRCDFKEGNMYINGKLINEYKEMLQYGIDINKLIDRNLDLKTEKESGIESKLRIKD